MRLSLLLLLAACWGLSACSDSFEPRATESAYALVRIGDRPLPVWDYPAPGSPAIIADTLLIPAAVAGLDGSPLTEIRVILDSHGTPDRGTQRYLATRRGDALLINNCPWGAACIAELVYSSTAYLFLGDSLFEQVPAASPLAPRVYGLVQPRR